jgi:hypothetical protein
MMLPPLPPCLPLALSRALQTRDEFSGRFGTALASCGNNLR